MSKYKSEKFILCLKKDDMVLKPSEVFDVLKEFDGEMDWNEANSNKYKIKEMMKKKLIESCPILLKRKDDGVDKVKERFMEENKKLNNDVKKPNKEIVDILTKQYTNDDVDPLATIPIKED